MREPRGPIKPLTNPNKSTFLRCRIQLVFLLKKHWSQQAESCSETSAATAAHLEWWSPGVRSALLWVEVMSVSQGRHQKNKPSCNSTLRAWRLFSPSVTQENRVRHNEREVWTRTNLHFSFMPLNCSSTQKVRDLTGGNRKIYVALLWGRICLMWQFNPLRNRSARSQNIKHSKFPPVVAALTLRAADYWHFLPVCLEKGTLGTLLKRLHLFLPCETFSLHHTESRFWEAKRQHWTLPVL